MPARVITITSGKGGVGKTITTANLGVSLALLGQRVVTIDADIGLRNLDVVMGLENRIVYDIVDVVERRCSLQQALIRDKRLLQQALVRDKPLASLHLLPAAQTRDKTAVSPEDMAEICDRMRDDFDFVLIDSPAGIERGFRNALAGADEALIITIPDITAVRDADRIIGLIESEGKEPIRLIINRINPKIVKRGDMLDIEDVSEALAIDLIGIVPEDEGVIVSTNKGVPIALDSRSQAGLAFQNIAHRLLGEDVPFMNIQAPGLIERLRRLAGLTREKGRQG